VEMDQFINPGEDFTASNLEEEEDSSPRP
jgi:hypothetical protein